MTATWMRTLVGEALGGTVKLSPLGRPIWQAEDDVGAEFRPRQQPR